MNEGYCTLHRSGFSTLQGGEGGESANDQMVFAKMMGLVSSMVLRCSLELSTDPAF